MIQNQNEREKAKRKRQQEIDEAMIMGYLLGNAGRATRMMSAEAAASGEW